MLTSLLHPNHPQKDYCKLTSLFLYITVLLSFVPNSPFSHIITILNRIAANSLPFYFTSPFFLVLSRTHLSPSSSPSSIGLPQTQLPSTLSPSSIGLPKTHLPSTASPSLPSLLPLNYNILKISFGGNEPTFPALKSLHLVIFTSRVPNDFVLKRPTWRASKKPDWFIVCFWGYTVH